MGGENTKGYLLQYGDDLVVATNNVKKWLEENNKQRVADGEDKETEEDFWIREVEIKIY